MLYILGGASIDRLSKRAKQRHSQRSHLQSIGYINVMLNIYKLLGYSQMYFNQFESKSHLIIQQLRFLFAEVMHMDGWPALNIYIAISFLWVLKFMHATGPATLTLSSSYSVPSRPTLHVLFFCYIHRTCTKFQRRRCAFKKKKIGRINGFSWLLYL